MEVVEIQGHRAKTAYLSLLATKPPAAIQEHGQDNWHPVEELRDPARYLKTEEFLRTLQERSRRKLKG